MVISWSPLAKGALLKDTLGRDRARRLDPSVKRARTPEEGGRGGGEEDRRGEGASPAAVVLAWHVAKGAFPIPGVKNVRQAVEVVEAVGLRLSESEVRDR